MKKVNPNGAWFRMYTDLYRNIKLRKLPVKHQIVFIWILCLKKEGNLDGVDIADLSWLLRLDENTLKESIAVLIENDLILEDFSPKGWNERQFVSDSSTERVAKYRQRRSDLGLTKHVSYDTKTVIDRDDGCCIYCGSSENPVVDHIYPIISGGTDDINNLACACKACNSGKAGRTPEQAGMTILSKKARNRYTKYLEKHVTVTETAQNRTEQSRTEYSTDFEKVWKLYPSSAGKNKSFGYFEKAIKSGVDIQTIIDGIVRYKTYTEAKRKNGFPNLQYQNGSTWFHNSEWESEWDISEIQNNNKDRGNG